MRITFGIRFRVGMRLERMAARCSADCWKRVYE
jgi:hypothetical protein